MKKFTTILFILAIAISTAMAQAPQQFKYQAALRDTDGTVMANEAVTVEIAILQGSTSGSSVFSESHDVTTTAQGIISLNIGSEANLSTVNWSADTYFIQITVDGIVMGASQLLSVPYAMHAKAAETLIGEITENDPVFESSPSSDIQTTDISNWNEAHTWGDHSQAGYVTNFDETDPLFSAWDKSTGILITESQITDLGSYIETESDPAFTTNFDFTDAANGDLLQFDGSKFIKFTPDYISDYTVTEGDVTAHQGALQITESQVSDLQSYLTSEIDPVFTAWDKDYADLINAPTTITTTQADAITANTAKNSYPEADATKLSGIEEGAQVNVQADWNQATTTADDYIKNKPTIPAAADGSETVINAGTNVTVTGTGTSGDPYVVNADDQSPTHYLGEEYLGGIIFYLYTGSDGQQHGLVVSKTESTGTWSGSTLVGADRTEDGAYNTNLMPAGSTAKTWVTSLGAGWYLPSIDELNLLWHNRFHVNKTARAISSTLLSTTAYYWSSTEYGATYAFIFYFYYGHTSYYSKTDTYSVRAVRAF